ncbi:MAG: cell division protein FtsZ [Bacteroidetes bacterium]|nr:cell division protein FtsZ [Bacteroidota bacterium]
MIHFDLPKEKSSIIKVIGVGGGGSNAVNHMHALGIDGVNFIICNTDAQAIASSMVPNKVQLGPHLTQGLGAGANPEIGRQATEESLEEIKRILEVNTKMAFITAGMGGGTGTGGAPIIAKICRDLGILTVGIVTTPFGYEGKKRMAQAEDGINKLRDYVDTLLVISNDKLRHQYGNLTMKAAFNKADNVLSTAAKCITDVINSTGQINVDFADVCTVMKNGGVAILGNASVSGEDRAQKAIEQALNSPLLNDSDIRGAKWILININSAEGEHEFTMDEVDTIQSYLLSQAGEDTDVILGLGYDSSLGDKIGITLIATGFEQKNPFETKQTVQPEVKQAAPEKIVMQLDGAPVEKNPAPQPTLFVEEKTSTDPFAPVLIEPMAAPVVQPVTVAQTEEKVQWVLGDEAADAVANNTEASEQSSDFNATPEETQGAVVSGGYLVKPAVIYAENHEETAKEEVVQEETVSVQPITLRIVQEEEETFAMELIEKAPQEERPVVHVEPVTPVQMQDAPDSDESEQQRKKTADRVNKLRNLSFNLNASDPNNEFEHVPAYLRRNLELYNTISPAENFYSNYTVQADDGNQPQISGMNHFLDGKKPD